VLTNTTGSQASPEERGRGYRIERGGKLEQHVGKQVRVTGWVDSENDRALMQGDRNSGRRATSGQTGASEQGRESASDRTDFNDLPDLHIDHIEQVSDNCSSR